jgi:hypothetical protein
MDHSKRRYSLDHHEGCVRPFTLATCEQAATMVFLGIPLGEGEWRIIANDFDMDLVLAGWILLNHADLAKDEMKLLAEAMPFIKIEGNIDSMGLDASILTGFPSDKMESERVRVMEAASLVKTPPGATKEEIATTFKESLEKIDELLLPESLRMELSEYTELGRVHLAKGKTAILCRSARGIYEVEAFYKSRYGSSLGIVVLTAGESRFTIRLVDGFLEGDMSVLYRHLNKIDPAAKKTADGENLWGGSSMIGGSPRQTGSELPPERILEAIRKVYGQETCPVIPKVDSMCGTIGYWGLVPGDAFPSFRSVSVARACPGSLGNAVC